MSIDSLDCVVRAVSYTHYGGNIIFKRLPERVGRAVAFTLTVRRSDEAGARRSATGRRIAAACWHAHRDVLRAIFGVAPNSRVKTAFADYRGVADFEDKFEDTGNSNIGSIVDRVDYRQACECEE
jgi:hypothetical protein